MIDTGALRAECKEERDGTRSELRGLAGSVQEMMEALGSLWYITAGWHIIIPAHERLG